mgnify:CR=1 FL=1
MLFCEKAQNLLIHTNLECQLKIPINTCINYTVCDMECLDKVLQDFLSCTIVHIEGIDAWPDGRMPLERRKKTFNEIFRSRNSPSARGGQRRSQRSKLVSVSGSSVRRMLEFPQPLIDFFFGSLPNCGLKIRRGSLGRRQRHRRLKSKVITDKRQRQGER